MFLRSLALVLVVAILGFSSVFAGTVPFKYPEMSATTLQSVITDDADSVAVILGGGPAGLTSAFALDQLNYFKYIFIVEDRTEYTRTNTTTLRPESILMLQRLGIFDDLSSKFIFSEDFRFFLHLPNASLFIPESFPGNPKELNFSHPDLFQVLQGAGWPHYAIKLFDYEDVLSNKLKELKNVYLISGKSKVISESVKGNNRHSVRITVKGQGELKSIDFINPRLIVVTEGPNSSTRGQAGILFDPIPENETQHWCSGAVSLNGIVDEKVLKNHITLVSRVVDGTVAFGVFRKLDHDLFLNGKMTDEQWATWSTEDCLRSNAFKILQEEAKYLNLNVPVDDKGLQVLDSVAGKFDLNLRSANVFHSRDNLIVLGDSAGNGSPIGGLGLTLVTSVYMDALTTLTKGLFEAVNSHAIERVMDEYDQRARQIVDFWHFSLKK